RLRRGPGGADRPFARPTLERARRRFRPVLSDRGARPEQRGLALALALLGGMRLGDRTLDPRRRRLRAQHATLTGISRHQLAASTTSIARAAAAIPIVAVTVTMEP